MKSADLDVSDWAEVDVAIYEFVVAREQEVIAQARMIVDQYWAKFERSNKTVLENRRTGQDPKRKTGVVAPVIEAVQAAGRYSGRVIWCTFGMKGYQQKNRNAWKRIPFSKTTGYENTYNPNAILKYSVGWDASAILETEAQLQPLRLALKNYQRIIVSIAARYRRVNRLTEKRVNTYGE